MTKTTPSSSNSTQNALKTTTSAAHYPELHDIREDLDSLKHNVVELTKHIRDDGKDEVGQLANYAKKRAAKLKNAGKHEMKKIEGGIKQHPMESVGFAVVAGVVLSFLLRRR